MSNASLVVRQYETATGLSERLGRALTELIRVHKRLPGAETLSVEDLAAARKDVRDIVSAVERALTGEWGDTHAHHDAITVPDGLATWLQAAHQGDAVRPHDLARVSSRLGTAPDTIDDNDIAVLERLSRIVDAQSVHLFHRLTQEAGTR